MFSRAVNYINRVIHEFKKCRAARKAYLELVMRSLALGAWLSPAPRCARDLRDLGSQAPKCFLECAITAIKKASKQQGTAA
jgi:hypothetical protein